MLNYFRFISVSAIAQILGITFTIAYAKIAKIEQIGEFAQYISIIGIIQIIITFRYDWAVVLADSDEEVSALTTLALIISVIVGIISITSLAIGNIIKIFKINEYIILTILSMPILAWQQLIYVQLIRDNDLKIVSANKLFSTILTGAATIILIKTNQENSLIIGWMFGSIVSSLSIIWYGNKNKKKYNQPVKKISRLKQTALKYKNFPCWDLPMSMIDAGRIFILNLIIISHYGAAINGAYFIAMKVCQMPVILLSASYGQIFIRNISNMIRNNKPTRKYVYRNILIGFAVSISIYIALNTLGIYIFNVILGDKWKKMYELIPPLSIWYVMGFIGTIISGLSIATQKQKQMIIPSLMTTATITIPVALGAYLNEEFFIVVLIQSISTAISISYLIYFSYKNFTTYSIKP